MYVFSGADFGLDSSWIDGYCFHGFVLRTRCVEKLLKVTVNFKKLEILIKIKEVESH